MGTLRQSRKELCAICGGGLRKTAITHEDKRAGSIYLVNNVPAQVCTTCGEVWIREDTLQEIERLIESGKPALKLETPVYEFAARVA